MSPLPARDFGSVLSRISTAVALADGMRNRPGLILWPTRDPAFAACERRRWNGHSIQEDPQEEIVTAIRTHATASPGSSCVSPRRAG